MNQKLQDIFNIIQKSEKLDTEQKENLLKAVKEADKEFEITTFKLERTEKVKKTTAILLEETIEELEQKRKAVEEQNRELEIEASLERVRAVAMSMHKSDDLLCVCKVLFEELQNLGFKDLRNSLINIFNDEKRSFINYDYSNYLGGSISNVLYNSHPANQEYVNQIRKANDAFVETVIDKNQLNEWKEFRRSHGEQDDPRLDNINALHYYNYSIGSGSIGISNYNPISEEQQTILKRFRNVFNLSYQRYMDIAQAEAQAREAEIELALERVRARSMAMQKSEELKEVIKLVYEQFVYLKINVDHAGFVVDYTPKGDWHFWIADQQEIPSKITHPYFDSVWAHQFIEAKEKRMDFFATNLNFEEKNKFYNELLSYVPGLPDKSKDFYLSCPGLAATTVLFDNVSLYIENFSGTPYTDEENKILIRFGKVFQQTYTRFLDLQKAELQAREAQIELALERVRARTMAMHNSQDVGNTVVTLFDEVLKLGLDKSIRCGIGILEGNERMETWSATSYPSGEVDLKMGMLDMSIHPMLIGLKKAWKNGEQGYSYNYVGDDVFRYYDALNKEPDYPFQIDLDSLPENEYHKSFFFTEGILFAFAPNPISEEASIVLDRFARVFGQTYRRYLDLQKAEEQAREAQIGASLEKVRAVAMSMNKSEDLLSICEASFKEFKKLGFDNIRNALIHIQYDEQKYFMDYDFSDLTGGAISKIEYGSHPVVVDYLQQINSTEDAFYQGVIKEDQLEEWKEFRRNSGQIDDPRLEQATALHYYFFSIGVGDIGISTLQPIDESQIKILKRFRNVFDLAYRRYNDIALAEEQARESQIQLALERVRARTMAMHKSEELSETSFVLFEQLKELGEIADQMSITIYDEEEGIIKLYSTIYGNKWEETGRLPFNKNSVLRKIHRAWKDKKKSIVLDLSGKELGDFNKFKMEHSTQYKSEAELPKDRWVMHYVFFSNGAITFSSHNPRPPETIQLLERFAGVFDLTYTRFLDLQKAEAQAREAQIEAALERVRSRSMAMHNTSELQDVINTVHQQFKLLDIAITGGAFVAINEENKNEIACWGAGGTADYVERVHIPFLDKPIYTGLIKCVQKGPRLFTEEFSYEEKIEFFNHLFKQPPYINSSQEHKKEILSRQGGYTRSCYVSRHTSVFIINHHGRMFSEEENNILIRFGKVFEQSYTRFLDLQKAEVQVREAEIETALERVRSKAMAMQKSDELAETASHFFEQLNGLGIKPYRFNIAIVDSKSVKCQLWSTTNEGKVIPLGPLIPLKEYIVFNQMYEGWKQQEGVSVIRVEGEDRIAWTKYIMKYVSFNEYKPENIDLEKLRSEPAIFSNFFFKQGFIVVHTIEEINNTDKKIIQRFVNVFEQTYTRFLDLQKAEAQAKEAIKQASLDRIRGEIASMRTSEDLNHITPIIWRELKTLEVPFFRCGVYIVDEKAETVQVYLTTPNGKSLGVLNLLLDSNEITMNTVEHWQKKKIFKTHWGREEFISWTKSMIEIGQVQNAETYQGSTEPPESLYLHFVPFGQGMLYVGDVQPLPNEKLELVKTLAEAFSIAYARYEDFRNLEEAKNKIEITLGELKSAQAQLVHSEKMASLGELTAGIAHEIKNPLNFVNNFSEISSDLINEIEEELEKNDKQEVLEILKDLKQNIAKINQHGKRADSIVKGMLLHSRGSSGEKTLTDINDLLDQYVNLAYHGMRAQNKEFNITIEKDYDKTLEKINVVPQDISRVFLNIINNACYAAYDKKKNSGYNNFSPTLKVSTKNLRDKVEIKIVDNGNGIPTEIADKIFQPFFTTKPAGEGTGLGLSLSYDIVTKVHKGELRVETRENEGTNFIISLPTN